MAGPVTEVNDFAPDMTGLSEAEKSHLLGVLRKAKEMEDEASLNQPWEGSLSKYTNVMKGFQFRWFVLDPISGQLDYYVSEEARKSNRPRGSVTLAGAVVSPTDEDSQTFNVNATNGEVFRLRAQDAKERQHWVSRLRAVVQKLNESLSKNLRQSTISPEQISTELPHSQVQHLNVGESPNSTLTYSTQVRIKRSYSSPATRESIHNAEQLIDQAQSQKHKLVANIESLPHSGTPITALEEECLLLKATSQSTVSCLEDCLNMLQEQDHTNYPQSNSDLEISKSMASISVDIKSSLPELTSHNFQSSTPLNKMPHIVPEINHDDDVCDPAIDEEKELGGVEQHKSVILHLLSQLKLGMDLTRVVLPTFILEKRSLLEMFADFFGHPDMFLRIADQVTPEARMLAVVEYYLCSFHVGRKGSLAKKPYNPIIGESFHCSWQVPSPQQPGQSSKGSSKCRLIYLAEQVSHHPPVTAFYTECPEKRIGMNAWIWTKSKFMGMSVGVVMVGDGNIHLLEHNENYTLTFPSAFGRSILTVPWMELGGKVNIHCQQTGFHASVTFLTKPFYGGKVHRVTAEVKNNSGVVVCKASGEWNGLLEFTYAMGEKKQIDTTRLSPTPKSVRPLEVQEPYESRKLWQHVTNSLKLGDLNTATEHKRQLEERQRHEEKHRKQSKTQWETQFFSKHGDGWLYKKPLN